MKKILLFLLLSVSIFAIEKPYYVDREINRGEKMIIVIEIEEEVPPFLIYEEIFERTCYALKYGQTKYPDKKEVIVSFHETDGPRGYISVHTIALIKDFDTREMPMNEIANELFMNTDTVSNIQFTRIIRNLNYLKRNRNQD